MPSLGWVKAKVATVLGLAVSMLAATGCGPYEPEPATPHGYWVRAEPPSSAELAANPPPRVSASDELAIGESADASSAYVDTDPSALTEFREALAPHGTWVEDDTYGTVWVPREEEVGADFQPYVTAGRWTYDDATSWVWVSDYSWGWAPFHYGRWVKLPGRGWSWIPGRTYSGAWVVWRTGPLDYGYVGWAPAPPSWYWRSGVAVGWGFGWYSPYYVYCPHSYVYHPYVGGYVHRSGPVHREAEARTQPYTPPGGGGDRVVATPGVGGGDRVVATPGIGGRTVASPSVGGPRPSELGHQPYGVPRPPTTSDPGLSRAIAVSAPRGGAARESLASRRGVPVDGNAVVGQPGSRLSPPASTSPRVQSRLDPVARAPQYPGVRPTTPRYDAPRASEGPLPSLRSQPRSTPSYASPSYPSTPPVRSSPSFGSSPSFRSTPSAPSVRSSPSFGSSPSFRSTPSTPSFRSTPSTPSFRSAPSAPSFRSAPSAPSFRSAPSGGGSFRSAPSVRSGGGGGSSQSFRGGSRRGR